MSEVKTKKKAEKVVVEKIPTLESQMVRDFGEDKLSQNAKSASMIARNFFNNGQEKFTAQDAHNVVMEQTGTNMSAHYPGTSYPESPLHRGLHALSKSETEETIEKEGQTIDLTARGQRGFLLKEGRVGLKKGGFYCKNPDVQYDIVEPSDLKIACETLVKNISNSRKVQ